MSLKDKLDYLEITKTNIGAAIDGKGGSVAGKTFREYADEITNLPVPTGDPYWKTAGWVDIEALYDADSYGAPNYAYMLISAQDKQTILPAGFHYVTSDGSTYNDNLQHTHTWNVAQDFTDAYGNKSRWVAVYLMDAHSVGAVGTIPNFNNSILWVVYGLGTGTAISGSTSAQDNTWNFSFCKKLVFVQLKDTTQTLSTGAFTECESLRGFEGLTNGLTTAASNTFLYCAALQIVFIKTISARTFRYNNALKYCKLGDTSNPFIDSFTFQDCAALERLEVSANFNTNNLNLSTCVGLGHQAIVDMLNNLFDRSATSSYTLTLGATNLAKLSAAEIAIATNKNWTLV